jgi:hypothetical protein
VENVKDKYAVAIQSIFDSGSILFVKDTTGLPRRKRQETTSTKKKKKNRYYTSGLILKRSVRYAWKNLETWSTIASA